MAMRDFCTEPSPMDQLHSHPAKFTLSVMVASTTEQARQQVAHPEYPPDHPEALRDWLKN